jgi:uncharacterized phage protein (TIGR01671 family)
MREIKFRAYHKKEKQMYYSDFVIHGTLGDVYWWRMEEGYKDTKQPDTFALMQFTGLHDKHGKPIYEGDLLKCNRWINDAQKQDWIIREVIFVEGSFYADYLLRDLASNPTLEIIGNIYQNKELCP